MSDCAVSYKRSTGCVLACTVSVTDRAFNYEQVNDNDIIETSSKNRMRQDYNWRD